MVKEENEQEQDENSKPKDWTVMVYMSGDSNLNVEMAYALDQMRSAAKACSTVRLYAYFDGFSEDVPTLYCDLSGEVPQYFESWNVKEKLIQRRRYRPHRRKESVDPDDIPSSDELNENSASINNAINFIYWCVESDKKTRDGSDDTNYAIIFSGHSFAFMDVGLFKDEKAGYSMSLSKLAWMFERVTADENTLINCAREQRYHESHPRWEERTTPILDKPFALLGFDSCVFSSLEISSQFVGVAKTIVASEGTVPSAGWNYAQILLGKISDAAAEPKDVAISFVDEFIKKQSEFALADLSVDMAAWNVDAIPALQEKFKDWASALFACFETVGSVEYGQMRRVLTYAHWQCQAYLLDQQVDLADLCQLLIAEIDLLKHELCMESFGKLEVVRVASDAVITAIRGVIMLSGFSGRDYQYSNGVSIFFPWSWEAYACAARDYHKLLLFRHKRILHRGADPAGIWITFLEKYLSEVTLRSAKSLTPIDGDRNPIISKGHRGSVVYDSYSLPSNSESTGGACPTVNGKQWPYSDRQWPYNDKQWPYSDKQWPYSDRQWPYSSKMAGSDGAAGILLRHFRAMKNVISWWNRAGFESTTVDYILTGKAGKNQILIPGAIEITEVENRIRVGLRALKVENKLIDELLTKLEGMENRLALLSDISVKLAIGKEKFRFDEVLKSVSVPR